MAQRKLHNVLAEFVRSIKDARALAKDAQSWSVPAAAPRISIGRRDSMTELAFLRAYLAWETFLEESFILYMLGQSAPRGRAPYRYAYPPSRRFAEDWIVSEGHDFASWGAASAVSSRAERFFRDGKPYAPTLRASQNLLDETKTVRNAIAHSSASASAKFEKLVRAKLGSLPPGIAIGAFLGTVVFGSTPPVSFFDEYVRRMEAVASKIVPS